jgi:hypothetical protein
MMAMALRLLYTWHDCSYIRIHHKSWAWKGISVIIALKRLRQEDGEFEASWCT